MPLALVPLRADMWALGVVAVVLLAGAYTDVRCGKILNAVTYPAVAIGLIGHTLAGGVNGASYSPLGLVGSLAGLAVGFLPLLLVWRAGGIGGGDAKLMGAVGALTGCSFTLAAMFYGFGVAAIMAIAVMLKRRIFRRTLGRIWRFLCLAVAKAKPADPAGPDSPKIPFGLALCIGTALHLVDYLFGGPVTQRLMGAGPGFGM